MSRKRASSFAIKGKDGSVYQRHLSTRDVNLPPELDAYEIDPLTDREVEILQIYNKHRRTPSRGSLTKVNEEAADELRITPNSLNCTLTRISEKLCYGQSNRKKMLREARRRGIIN